MSSKKPLRPKLVDHRHCRICGKAIPPKEEFCSPECREKFEEAREKEKKAKRMLWIFYGLIMASLLIFLLLRAFIG